jgi:metal-responsive CopG/Arc/MetJ family transcriptional regulator
MTAKNRMSISLTDKEKNFLDVLAGRSGKSRSQVMRDILKDFMESDMDRFNILKNGTGGPLAKRK